MPKSIKLPFLPRSLQRLREISGAKVSEAAKSVRVDEATIHRWESDDRLDLPTYSQGQKLGKLYGYDIVMCLAEIPEDVIPPKHPDFRMAENDGEPSEEFSVNFRRQLREVNFRQRTVLEFASYWELPHQNWVGSVNAESTDPEELGGMIRDQLRIGIDGQASFALMRESKRMAMKAWTRAAGDHAGVFVGQSSNQKGRHIEVGEMRGFSLADPVAPFAIVNARDAQAARIFTLFHELAHLWIGKPGVSGYAGLSTRNQRDRDGVEAYCDEAAASALMPRFEFADAWRSSNHNSPLERATSVADQFSVSRDAAVLRAAKNRHISWDAYHDVRRDLKERRADRSQKRGTGGGNFYYTLIRNVGERYARLVIGAWMEDEIGLKQAARYLKIKPVHVFRLAETFGVRL